VTTQLMRRPTRPHSDSRDTSCSKLPHHGMGFRKKSYWVYPACLAVLLTAILAMPQFGHAAAVPPRARPRPQDAQPASPGKEGIVKLTGNVPEIPDKVPQVADYNVKLEDEKFYLCVPPNYRDTEPFGLLVFVHAGEEMSMPPDWKPMLAKRKLLYVAPQKVGNDHLNNRRIGMAIVAICKMMEMYKVDPKRVYVTGLSGGARIACLTAFAHPNLVSAVLPMCGAEFPAAVPKVLATRDDPTVRSNAIQSWSRRRRPTWASL
jgi:hypothetical protein